MVALKIDKIAGMEARGFIFGAAVAVQLGIGFVPVRKPGKLPIATIGIDYALEYGTDRLEMDPGAIEPGQKVVMVDDLIATGGTALASAEPVDKKAMAIANVVSRLLIGVQHGGSAPKETTSPCQIDWNSSVKRYAFAFFA